MLLEAVPTVAAVIFAVACSLQLALAGCFFYLLWLYRRLRPAGFAQEAQLLAVPIGPDEALPDVVVQIPTFNEGEIVRRIARAAAGLDWPRARLHVQFLDDSVDGSERIVAEAVAALQAEGIDAELLRRADRKGFKAGALQAGLLASPHAYFAIFDVDYVPPPDFLRRCLPPLLADEALAFVQARFEYLNPDQNLLTRIQAVLLDHHLGIEQRTRNWAGHLVPCNGTCVVWRRAAIEAGGGWKGDTLAEDMDLSYRAWLAGWRGTYLGDITAPGELPEVMKHWLHQQRRWKRGYTQVAWRYLPRILIGRLQLRAKWGAFLHLGFVLSAPLSTTITLSALTVLLTTPFRALPILELWLGMVLLGYLAAAAALGLGQRELRHSAVPAWRFLWWCVAGFGWRGYMDLVDGLLTIRETRWRGQRVFERTPKLGRAGKP
jgi:cellulose synthase/poly-beta-1,6-N-acetylglucosamine synthase-like glycosyltransferase